MALDSV